MLTVTPSCCFTSISITVHGLPLADHCACYPQPLPSLTWTSSLRSCSLWTPPATSPCHAYLAGVMCIAESGRFGNSNQTKSQETKGSSAFDIFAACHSCPSRSSLAGRLLCLLSFPRLLFCPRWTLEAAGQLELRKSGLDYDEVEEEEEEDEEDEVEEAVKTTEKVGKSNHARRASCDVCHLEINPSVFFFLAPSRLECFRCCRGLVNVGCQRSWHNDCLMLALNVQEKDTGRDYDRSRGRDRGYDDRCVQLSYLPKVHVTLPQMQSSTPESLLRLHFRQGESV